ncbi:site-specific recombinase [Alishewanella sp. SMS8]|uniref:site-specific recombinase n=1 Tax=unclassified Alishewanella TaxID=2628974 RepID=UPI002741BCDF|nr:recombinase [Alishewanella sp. SMS8]MDP5459978.1 recombinase [Alishewanella sp. SMS8]
MDKLNALMLVRALAAEKEGLPLLKHLVGWVNESRFSFERKKRAKKLLETLQQNLAESEMIANNLFSWLCSVHIYPALVSLGVFSRRGFFRELSSRLYEKVNPAPRDLNELKDVLAEVFKKIVIDDEEHVDGPGLFTEFSSFFLSVVSKEKLTAFEEHMHEDALCALEMLSVWIAAEEMEPDLMRLDKRLNNIDSAFIALHRELNMLVGHYRQKQPDVELPLYDCAHYIVMVEQCYEQIDRLRRRAAAAGSTVAVSHLLERLEQTLSRIEQLVILITGQDRAELHRHTLELTEQLLYTSREKKSVRALWRSSTQLLSKSISVNKSSHGEHYITRDKSQFFGLVASAAGAGVIIAVMALIKIHIQALGLSPFSNAALASLNYGLGFVLIHMLGLTVATKQPAMTAASFAAEVEKGENGRAAHKKLATLLIDVNRSQWAAVWGNVSIAVITASIIALSFWYWQDRSILDAAAVSYQLDAISPWHGSLFFAAIAGVWLFCSGIIAGFFENRANYLELNLRLYQHPLLKRLLPQRARKAFAEYWHENYGALAGNFFFGVLLGMTSYLGYLLDLPLDIRHVAFASANLGYSTVDGDLGLFGFLFYLVMVLLIGFVNLWVSFTLALTVALRARGTQIGKFSLLLKSVFEQIKQNPLNLFFPIVQPAKPTQNNKKADDSAVKRAEKPQERVKTADH